MSLDHTASVLFKHVNKILKKYNCEKKFVAQTYDSVAVTNKWVCDSKWSEQTSPRNLSTCHICSLLHPLTEFNTSTIFFPV